MAPVLLLDAGCEPLAVLTHRRAFILLLRGSVEPRSNEYIAIRGVTRTFFTPTVIRLRRPIDAPYRREPWSRKSVLERDRFRCAYCGRDMRDQHRRRRTPRIRPTIDHILPVSRGGKSSWTNTVCACPACNQRKANRTPREAGMRLLWVPRAPGRMPDRVADGLALLSCPTIGDA